MTFKEAVQDFLTNKWTRPSKALDKKINDNAPPESELVSSDIQRIDLCKWVMGLRMLESLLEQQTVAHCDKVPIVAPAMICESVGKLTLHSTNFMGSVSSVFKAFIQLYGYDPKVVMYLAEALQSILSAVSYVAINSVLVALTVAQDKQTGEEKPALDVWQMRFAKSSEIWGELIKDADPAKMSELAVMYQAKLMEYAITLNPQLAKLPPVEDKDLEQFSKTSGIPVDRLRELLKRPAKVEEVKEKQVEKPPEGKAE